MAKEDRFDLVVKNVRLARPGEDGLRAADIGIKDGRFTAVEDSIEPDAAREVHDGGGLLAFPGVVDSHMHIGIYRSLDEDARSETQAAAMGGVTTSLTYIRTGQYYLNRGGPYQEFFPEVLRLAQDNYHVDYGFHLMPASWQHIDEMEQIYSELGIPTFKIFMFYGGYGLHGKSDSQSEFLMVGPEDEYGLGHFEFVMRGARRVIEAHPEAKDLISVSLHCENPDLMNTYTTLVQREGKLSGLEAYHAARPPHSEGMAIWIAAYLAHVAECPNINLLHLSSRHAVEAATMMQETLPHISFGREATVGHLLLDLDADPGTKAKVNPPIRPADDREYLWRALGEGKIDWIVTDHACCPPPLKFDAEDPDNVWGARSGFGGTEYLLSGIHSEGSRRGLSPNRIAELLCRNPARRFGLKHKGDVAPGFDGDLVLFDPEESFVVRAADSPSAQEYTPFEGVELRGRVKRTYLRGRTIYDGSGVVGSPSGRYVPRRA